MTDKRMFSNKVCNSDAFKMMPLSTQALYFHLCLNADDDGFVDNPITIQKSVGCGVEDLRLLLEKRYILAFEDGGVIVIKHWRMHNTIQKDRYKPTVYQEELSTLVLKETKVYTEKERHPELVVANNNSADVGVNSEWFIKSQEYWDKTFAEYPKKYAEDKARYEWEQIVQGRADIEDRIELTRMVYRAVRKYVEDYKKNSPEDTTFKYVPRFDRWLVDQLPVWEKRVRQDEK